MNNFLFTSGDSESTSRGLRNSHYFLTKLRNIVVAFLLTVGLTFVSLVIPSSFARADEFVTDDSAEINGRQNVLNKLEHKGVYGPYRDLAANNTRLHNPDFLSFNRQEAEEYRHKLEPKGFFSIERKRTNEGKKQFFVRETEIVPHGENPTAKTLANHQWLDKNDPYDIPQVDLIRYVPDNGNFVPLDKATAIPAPHLESSWLAGFVGNRTLVENWTFGDLQGDYVKEKDTRKDYIRDTALTNEYMDETGLAGIGVFKGQGDDNNYYWCINPLAPEPISGQNYILQPTRFTGQTSFSDRPELPYLVTMLNNSVRYVPGTKPPLPKMYKYLAKYFNEKIRATDDETLDLPTGNDPQGMYGDKQFLDRRITNREIKEKYLQLSTHNGEETEINHEHVRVQNDREYALEELTDVSWSERKLDGIIGPAVEYALQKYTMGYPFGDIDKFINLYVGPGYVSAKTWNEVHRARVILRLLLAFIEVAREKGLLAEDNPTTPDFNLTIKDSSKQGDITQVKVGIEYTGELAKRMDIQLQFRLPRGSKITVDPSEKSSLTTSTSETSEDTYYNIPANKTSLLLNYSGDEPKVEIPFLETKTLNVAGLAWSDSRNFRYDTESGHWIARELINMNDGRELGQQIISFTPQDKLATIPLSLNFEDKERLLTTQVTAGGVSATPSSTEDSSEATPAQVTLSRVIDGQTVKDQIAEGLEVTDTITYKNFDPGNYHVVGKIYKIAGSATTAPEVDESSPVATKEADFTIDSSAPGTTTLDFGKVQGLEYETSYVVYESVYPSDDSTNPLNRADHKDPYDKLQTFVTPRPAGSLKTRVMVHPKDGESTSSSAVESATVTYQSDKGIQVIDTVSYKNLGENKKYKGTATLVKIDGDNETIIDTTDYVFTSNSFGNHTVFMGRDIANPQNVKYYDLQPGTYVVYQEVKQVKNYTYTRENDGVKLTVEEFTDEETPEYMVAPHKDKTDKAQSFNVITGKKPVIRTTVLANDTPADDAGALVAFTAASSSSGVKVVDHVSYKDLEPNGHYSVSGFLVKVTGERDARKFEKVVAASEPVVKTASDSGSSGNTPWSISFGSVKGLEPGGIYVVYEYVTPTTGDTTVTVMRPSKENPEPQQPEGTIEHHDPDDLKQTIEVTREPRLRTVVSAAGGSAVEEKGSTPASERVLAARYTINPVTVRDRIHYERLVPGEEYVFTGRLMRVDNGREDEIATASVKARTTASGSGDVTVNFGKQALQPEARYVVFEKAVSVKNVLKPRPGSRDSAKKETVEHQDKTDKAQTIVVEAPESEGSLATTVSINGTRSTAETPVTVPADDVDSAAIVDHVRYTSLKPGVKYNLSGTLYEVAEGKIVDDPIATGSQKFTVAPQGSGEVDVPLTLLQGRKLMPGKSYVVFEIAVREGEIADSPDDPRNPLDPNKVLRHEDPQDVLQSLVVERKRVPAFSTRVGFHKGLHADKDAPLMVDLDYAKSYSLYDLVSYQDLTPGESYHLAGQLMDVTDGEGQYKQIAAGETTFTPTKESDTVKVNFTSVMLKPGRKYVVFEHLTGGNPAVDLTHQDVEDKAQTILSGELKTVACADDHDSSKDRAVRVFAGDGRKSTLTDAVYYAGLLPSSNYQLTGSLYQVETDDPQGDHVPQDASPVATKTITFTTSPSGSGKVELPFGQVTLTPGRKYVVFENARSESEIRSRNYATVENVTPPSTTDDNGNNGNGDGDDSGSADGSDAAGVMVHHVLRHENPQDRAQTVVAIEKRMPSLLTAVQIGDRKATSDSELVVESSSTPVKVVDNVYYTGFAVGKEYQVTGRLMKIIEGQAPVEVATASSEKFTPVKANDQVAIHFAPLVLEPGVKYVVFETAVSTEKIALKDITDPNSELVVERVVHANANDKAQTIRVVKPNKPEKPTTPENPPTPPVEPPTPPENPPAPPVTPPVTPPDTPPTPPTPPVVPPDTPPAPPVPPVNPPSEPPTPPENPGVPPLPPTPDKPVLPTPPVPDKPPTPPATPPEKPGLPPTGSSIVGAVIGMSVLTLISAAVSLLRKRLQDK